jgi:glycosyltransferase involved in cell wall biosynthesis
LEALEKNPRDQNQDDVVRIAYVGTIISATGFLKMLGALKKVRATLPQKIVLEFFGGRNYRSCNWFEPDWMTEHGMFTDNELVAALRRCDWGIVVMDPESEDLRYSRFSFPNKVGTYLSAGVPVLGFGHPHSSLAEIMRQNRLGVFSCATSQVELEKFLAENLRLPSPRESFRADILKCARTEFSADQMRAQLWRLWGAR